MPCSLNPSHSVFQNIQNLALLLLSLYNTTGPSPTKCSMSRHAIVIMPHRGATLSTPETHRKDPFANVIATDRPRTLDSRHSQSAPSVIDTDPRVPN